MFPSHKQILEILRQHPASTLELHKITGYSRNGIRSRITELRKKRHYTIQQVDGKHTLVHAKENRLIERIASHLSKHNLHGQRININLFADELKVEKEELEDALVTLYRRGKLLQMSKNEVIIYFFR